MFFSDNEADNIPMQPTLSSCATQTVQHNLQQLSAKLFATEPRTIHYYTSLESYNKFLMVFDTLGSAAYKLQYYQDRKPPVTVNDQFFITLIKL